MVYLDGLTQEMKIRREEETKLEEGQCDQKARVFFNLWPFTTMKNCPIPNKIAKVSFKLCKRLNKPSQNYQRL